MRGLALTLNRKNAGSFLERLAAAQAIEFDEFVLVAQDADAPARRALESAQANGARIRTIVLEEGISTRQAPEQPGFAKLASTDRQVRVSSVEMVRGMLGKLGKLSLTGVVIEGGNIVADGAREALLALSSSVGDTDALGGITKLRERLVPDHLEALSRSIFEIARAAESLSLAVVTPDSPLGVCLPSEMDGLLTDDPKRQRHYWHSTGSAQCLERMGVVPAEAWLERFGGKLVGVFLSDTIGGQGGQLPGLGEVDFKRVASYLRPGLPRVMAVGEDVSAMRLMFGRDHLQQMGIFS